MDGRSGIWLRPAKLRAQAQRQFLGHAGRGAMEGAAEPQLRHPRNSLKGVFPWVIFHKDSIRVKFATEFFLFCREVL
jgi:hypothetical protein